MARALTRPGAIAAFLLAIMFLMMAASSWNNAATMDELAHIPAGYAYVYLRDYRLTPEHPPLAKALAALALVGEPLSFPTDVPSWRDEVNGQWEQGRIFLYESGNDADRIIRRMHVPMMLCAVFFGWLLWLWVRREFGATAANLTLFFFAFSPTVIAHSPLVTTDLAAAFAFFIGIIAYLAFLKRPTAINILIAGLAFGTAELLKFSLILLVPIYALLTVVWCTAQTNLGWPDRFLLFIRLAVKAVAIAIIALLLIWVVYAATVAGYPPDRQYHDAQTILSSFPSRSWAAIDLWLIERDYLRPLGQYFLGLTMVLQRASGGNTQYFGGEVTNVGFPSYFPILYLLKEPLAFHILTAIAAAFALRRVWRARASLGRLLGWIQEHFIEFASIAFIGIYWVTSISSPLNIGVRHVLPTFPFVYALTARELVSWLRVWRTGEVTSWNEWLQRLYHIYVTTIPKYLLVAALILWQAASVVAAFPYYLSYYNELGGGVNEGYRVAVDSNYDWGQDLKRLRDYADEHGIRKIHVDYFGAGSPAYYLGDRAVEWHSSSGYPSDGGWLAISATFQMGAYGTTVKGFQRKPEDSYEWLKPFRPVARAGKSIFIYQLPAQPQIY